MNKRIKYRLTRIFTILIFWMAFAVVIAIHEYLFLQNFEGIFESSYLEDYSFEQTLISGLVATFIGALTIGLLEELYFRDRLKKLAFGKIVVIKTLLYSGLIIGITILGSLIFNSQATGRSMWDPIVFEEMQEYVSSGGFLNTVMIFVFSVLLTIIAIQISDKFGPGVLWKFISGKYHDTIEEERAFMFLDIKSSTQIAERIGHKQYFKMLNDFFADITYPIMENNGEIYQYVGDEVVISWKQKDYPGLFTCYKEIVELISSRKEYYQASYDLVPGFKSGCHAGQVTVGEVGVIKREIVYTGDVLNTSARIQGMCNKLNASFLISDQLIHALPPGFEKEEIGDMELRGKNTLVKIFKVTY